MASTRTARRQTAGSFVRLPGSQRPFKRALALEAKVLAIVGKGLIPTDRQLEIDALPPYVSRGHGGQHRTKNRIAGARWYRDRSKYDPHEEDMKHYPTRANATLRRKLGLDGVHMTRGKHEIRD